MKKAIKKSIGTIFKLKDDCSGYFMSIFYYSYMPIIIILGLKTIDVGMLMGAMKPGE